MLPNSNFSRRSVSAFVGLLALVTMVAVGAVGDLEELRVRAEARWAALIAGNFDEAYQFETPAYRDLYKAQQYRAHYGKGMRWQRAKVVKMDLKSPEVAIVTLEIDYSFSVSGQGMMDNKGLVTESWVWIGNQWWHQLQ